MSEAHKNKKGIDFFFPTRYHSFVVEIHRLCHACPAFAGNGRFKLFRIFLIIVVLVHMRRYYFRSCSALIEKNDPSTIRNSF